MYSQCTDQTAQMTCVHWLKGLEGSRRVGRKTFLHPRVMYRPLMHATLSPFTFSLFTSPVLLSSSSPQTCCPRIQSNHPLKIHSRMALLQNSIPPQKDGLAGCDQYGHTDGRLHRKCRRFAPSAEQNDANEVWQKTVEALTEIGLADRSEEVEIKKATKERMGAR